MRRQFHWTPLHIAIRDGHFEVVVFFLSKTRDANFTDQACSHLSSLPLLRVALGGLDTLALGGVAQWREHVDA